MAVRSTVLAPGAGACADDRGIGHGLGYHPARRGLGGDAGVGGVDGLYIFRLEGRGGLLPGTAAGVVARSIHPEGALISGYRDCCLFRYNNRESTAFSERRLGVLMRRTFRPIVVLILILAVVLFTRVQLVKFLDVISPAVTAIATVLIAWFTATIWDINRSQLAHGQRVDRAYVNGGWGRHIDGKLYANINNDGKTPATVHHMVLAILPLAGLPSTPPALPRTFVNYNLEPSPPSPPAEKATARQDQTRESGTDEGAVGGVVPTSVPAPIVERGLPGIVLALGSFARRHPVGSARPHTQASLLSRS